MPALSASGPATPQGPAGGLPGLRVAFVPGVTPGKWARAWSERMPRHPLSLLPLDPPDALAALAAATADMALLRMPVPAETAGGAAISAIPLYEEQAVVVAAKDHAIAAADAVALSELGEFAVLEGQWGPLVELVATGVGVAVMPQSVARAFSRRDVIARPVTDAPPTRIALAWLTGNPAPELEEFIGIVRGRTANSSRGARPVEAAGEAPAAHAGPRGSVRVAGKKDAGKKGTAAQQKQARDAQAKRARQKRAK